MKKTILTAACAGFIGLTSIATASAQFVTGTNEGASATSMSNTSGDTRMNSMNKMKKKKMMKKGMGDGMSGGMDKSGSMSTGGGMSGSGEKGMSK